METLTRKTASKARLTLPGDFASCLVTIERHGEELRVARAKLCSALLFQGTHGQVYPKKYHAEISTGAAAGREIL